MGIGAGSETGRERMNPHPGIIILSFVELVVMETDDVDLFPPFCVCDGMHLGFGLDVTAD